MEGQVALHNALPRAAHKPLGLPLIGAAVAEGWTHEEEEQFEEGMLLFGRDFPAIRKQFLPQRETEHLVLYYYNVWKTQMTLRAQAWYQRLAEVSLPFVVEKLITSVGYSQLNIKRVRLLFIYSPDYGACLIDRTVRYTTCICRIISGSVHLFEHCSANESKIGSSSCTYCTQVRTAVADSRPACHTTS